MMSAQANPEQVIVFRKKLLSYSETFIADQGHFLPTYRPVYAGFSKDNSGLKLIADATQYHLIDFSALPSLSKLLFRRNLGGGSQWINAMRQYAPGLIHAHFFNDGVDAIKLGQRLDIPVVTTLHGHDITKHANAKSGSTETRSFFQRVDKVIAVSNFIAAQAISRGCPENKLIQHYIGIDLERFQQEKCESEQPTLLFVGRLVEKKGCSYLLQAMERLHAEFPELELTIVGEGPLKATLQQEAIDKTLRVNFVGTEPADSIRQRLATSWLFVAPSITAASGDAEGLGMVFLEAQALKTPVVSFRSGGVVEAVADGITGLLCNEKDVGKLTDNIRQLLNDADLRMQMGKQGRQRVEQQFDIRKQCERLEQIYTEVR
ncbi:MAG: colanic acid/amylovoran biosynthesis glycosyltransferase [Gammaproteobacteria bacterium]|jgi:colanic acid/amylovoran biosynthesis glycosyltransferase